MRQRFSELCAAGAVVKCDRTVGLFMHFDTSCGAHVDRYVDVRASRHSRESACFLVVNRQCGSWMDY